MSNGQPVTIQVPREAVEHCNPIPVANILASFIPSLCERNRNCVQIEVLGYNNDPRELFDIPEVRKYFQSLFNETPGLLYWIDIDSYMFIFLGLMLYTPKRVHGQVTLNPDDLQHIYLEDSRGLMNSASHIISLQNLQQEQSGRSWVCSDFCSRTNIVSHRAKHQLKLTP